MCGGKGWGGNWKIDRCAFVCPPILCMVQTDAAPLSQVVFSADDTVWNLKQYQFNDLSLSAYFLVWSLQNAILCEHAVYMWADQTPHIFWVLLSPCILCIAPWFWIYLYEYSRFWSTAVNRAWVSTWQIAPSLFLSKCWNTCTDAWCVSRKLCCHWWTNSWLTTHPLPTIVSAKSIYYITVDFYKC